MESLDTPPVVKQGMLGKQGGGAGGHKNWKDRYFVLSDHLYYYTNQAAYQKEPKAPLGRVVLNAYFCSKVDDSTNYEFVINAYPKSLTLRAKNAAELDEWIDAIMKPLEELSTAPTAPPAADAKPAVPAAGAGDAAPAAGAGAAS